MVRTRFFGPRCDRWTSARIVFSAPCCWSLVSMPGTLNAHTDVKVKSRSSTGVASLAQEGIEGRLLSAEHGDSCGEPIAIALRLVKELRAQQIRAGVGSVSEVGQNFLDQPYG